MAVIKLKSEGPIVSRVRGLDTAAMTEVGFIPGDDYGCKIYGKNTNGRMTIIGIHSRTYGCNADPQTDGVEIVSARVKTPHVRN